MKLDISEFEAFIQRRIAGHNELSEKYRSQGNKERADIFYYMASAMEHLLEDFQREYKPETGKLAYDKELRELSYPPARFNTGEEARDFSIKRTAARNQVNSRYQFKVQVAPLERVKEVLAWGIENKSSFEDLLSRLYEIEHDYGQLARLTAVALATTAPTHKVLAGVLNMYEYSKNDY